MRFGTANLVDPGFAPFIFFKELYIFSPYFRSFKDFKNILIFIEEICFKPI